MRAEQLFKRFQLVLALIVLLFGSSVVASTRSGLRLSGTPPIVDHGPTPQATILGGRVRFTVVASGEPPLSYRWQHNGDDLSDGDGVSGATTEVLTLTGARFEDDGEYAVVVTNAGGSVVSDAATLTLSVPQGGDVDFEFDSGLETVIDGAVLDVVLDADGKVLICGDFSIVRDALRGKIARLNRDGSTDHSFGNGLTGANGRVNTMAVQPDGRIVVGGEFSAVNGVSRNRIARINSDGSLDTTFLNGLTGPNGDVLALAVQPDGRILVGGQFGTFNGVARSRLTRLNPDGSLDPTFASVSVGPPGTVWTILVQPDGRILVGGNFFTVNGTNRQGIARINSDGSLDPTFSSAITDSTAAVKAIWVAPDGRILLAGNLLPPNNRGVTRLESDGSIDDTFRNGLTGPGESVDLIVQPDGRIVIAGLFTTVDGFTHRRIARLNSDGTVDSGFVAQNDGPWVFALALSTDSGVIVGGDFTGFNGIVRYRIAHLDVNGEIDPASANSLAGNQAIGAIAVQPDGRLLVGGIFATIHGVSRPNLARMNVDGAVDTTFADGLPGFPPSVTAIAVQPDGRILVGGAFTTVYGENRNRICRLHADGSLDETFLDGLAGADATVYEIKIQTDGRILIAGSFTSVNGVSRNRIARLNSDGSIDATFMNGLAGANNIVSAIAVQPDGRVIIGGFFTSVNGTNRNRIARLNSDGSLDVGFLNGLPGANNSVSSMVLQPDGRILVAGAFSDFNGFGRTAVARLNSNGSVDMTFGNGLVGAVGSASNLVLQSDGSVLASAISTDSRWRVLRLAANGSVDPGFVNAVPLFMHGEGILDLALQPDGRVLVGGTFQAMNGSMTSCLTRLYGSLPTSIAVTTQPADAISYDECCAVLRVEASGSPLDYQWRRDGVALQDAPNVTGTRSSVLSIAGITEADSGVYTVVVSNVLDESISNDAELTIATVPQCQAASCDAVLGCALANASEGGSCDDGVTCTTGDTCVAGSCIGDAPAPPSEVSGVVATDKLTVSWEAVPGTDVRYDAVRGTTGLWPVSGNAGQECMQSDDLATSLIDASMPSEESGYWYLVRARLTCGSGSYGAASSGVERVSVACP